MKLTGQAEKAFNKYWKARNERVFPAVEKYATKPEYKEPEFSVRGFNDLCDSMKWGCLEDFFDSVDIDIDICKYVHPKSKGQFNLCVDLSDVNSWHETRHEARIQAIYESNEILNNK